MADTPNEVPQQVFLPAVGQDLTYPIGCWPEGKAFKERVPGPAVWTEDRPSGPQPVGKDYVAPPDIDGGDPYVGKGPF